MKRKEKKNKIVLKVISIILIILLFLSLLAFSIIYFVILSPKNNYAELFNTVFDKTINIASKMSKDEYISSINKGNLKIDTNLLKYKNITGYEIEYDIENERQTNKTLIDLKLGDDEEKLESTIYYEPNNLYIDFPYIMSIMIKIPLDKFGYKTNNNTKFSYTKEEANYVLSIIKNSFINNLNNKKMKNSISSYHIKSTYNIDYKELERLLDIIINDLKKDSKAMNILKNYNIDESKLNEYKNNLLLEFNNKLEFLEINMFINISFKLDRLTINSKTYNSVLLFKDINELTIKSNDKEIISSSFNKESLKATINRNSKIIETNLKIDKDRNELNLEGTLNYKNNNNEYIKIELNTSTLLNEKISDFDTTQAKSFSQFTKKDLKSVYKIIDIINKYIELFTGNKNKKISLKK